jgi:hypothetical protein
MLVAAGVVFAESGSGTARAGFDPDLEGVVEFSFDDDMRLDLRVPLVQDNQAPGVAPGTLFSKFPGGVAIGGTPGSGSVRGFVADLTQSAFPGSSESAVFITDVDYAPVFVFQAGAPVPDTPNATINKPDEPAMGLNAAAFGYELVDSSEVSHAAIGFVDYETSTFHTVAVVGDQVPGGGEITSLSKTYAINDTGYLVFRAVLGGNQAAYYAASTTNPNAPLRRLVGTGDVVALPQGGSATITSLGLIPPTGGLGGEPTAVGAVHFTVNATLDDDTGAILLVEIGD